MSTKTKAKPFVPEDNEQFQNPRAWWGKVQEKAQESARWMSLFEAVNLIADKAEEKGEKFEDIELDYYELLRFVEASSDQYLRKILSEDHHIDICYPDDASANVLEYMNEGVEVKMHKM